MIEKNKSKFALILSMLIFSTVGIFRKYIPLPSGAIAFTRGLIGALFLLVLTQLRGKRLDFLAIRQNLAPLCLSGAVMGFNWILLFEAYNYTSVAVATLCYYMAPVFVILVSPFLFRERLSAKKIVCIAGAVVGMVFVSGILTTKKLDISEMKGVLLGLGAAVLYASVVLINKKTKEIEAEDRTVLQLAIAAIVILPYVLLAEDLSGVSFTPIAVFLTLFVGIVHTGFAYVMYFGSMKNIEAQTVAIFSYIDPVGAIILSALILNEKMDIFSIIGAVMILGFTMLNELPEKGRLK